MDKVQVKAKHLRSKTKDKLNDKEYYNMPMEIGLANNTLIMV
jgi:hypothetical protein